MHLKSHWRCYTVASVETLREHERRKIGNFQHLAESLTESKQGGPHDR